MQPKIKVKQNYTPNDVGMLLGVHHNTIKNWIKSNQVLAFQTVGGHYRVPRREVVRVIKDRGLPVPEELQGPMGLVYIVDDDELIRRAMEDALDDTYEVYTFSNGFDALMQMGRHVIGISGKGVDPAEAKSIGFNEFFDKKDGLLPIVGKVKDFLGTSV
jgi:excisionase family DNA binding protein